MLHLTKVTASVAVTLLALSSSALAQDNDSPNVIITPPTVDFGNSAARPAQPSVTPSSSTSVVSGLRSGSVIIQGSTVSSGQNGTVVGNSIQGPVVNATSPDVKGETQISSTNQTSTGQTTSTTGTSVTTQGQSSSGPSTGTSSNSSSTPSPNTSGASGIKGQAAVVTGAAWAAALALALGMAF
ncbi:Hypothetical protein D9617_4g000350 [Elsinoe fawcettii]|nr:Hypothetical protein D9617_4g000350 [Elsinoe fawcettii]